MNVLLTDNNAKISNSTSLTVSTIASNSVNLDAIRGLAALAVFANHLRALFFVDYDQVVRKGMLVKLGYLLTGLGHEAVVVFFVLSGYLIAGSVLKAEANDRWSWRHYASNRLTRLYVVLLPALVIGAFWDRLGLRQFAHSGVYTAASDYRLIIPIAIERSATWTSWLGNLFYLQGILVRPFGSNGPLWSLSYEFWYYVLFPLLWIAGSSTRAASVRFCCLLLALIASVFVGKAIMLYFLIWLMGAALNYVPSLPQEAGRPLIVGTLVLFTGTLLISRFRVLHEPFMVDLLIGIFFTLALYTMLNIRQHTTPWYARLAVSLSSVSYTMYLVHVPFLVFVNGFVLKTQPRWQPVPISGIAGSGIAAITLAYSWIVWRATEANTDRVRSHLRAFAGHLPRDTTDG